MLTRNPASRPGKAAPGKRHDLHALFGTLLLSAFLLPPAQVQAQDNVSLPNLLFEPVLLDVVTTDAPESATPYTVQELTTLPQGRATDLQAWLDARNSSGMATPDDLVDDIAAYEKAVAELETAGGAFDPRLDQELLALGSLLQQAGDFNRAQELLDRSLHINRVNNGLFGMTQIPIIERSIQNHLARGDLVAADEQQEYLLYVQRKNHGDGSVDLLPALTRYAEWNLFAFRARLVPSIPPDASPDESTDLSNQADANSERMLEFRTNRLINAHFVYQSIISILTNNFGNADSRLLNFERQLALTNYLFITNFGIDNEVSATSLMPYSSYLVPFDNAGVGRPPLGFRQGRDALERRINYLVNEPGTPAADIARARLDLADWMLMFSKRMGALEVYQAAYHEMVASGAPAEELSAIFNPPYPQEIPSFLDPPFSRTSLDIPADVALEYKGYIDVEFELSRFGVPSRLSVLSKSSTASPALEGRLLRNLRRTQFRPRISEGLTRDDETLRVRFYFTY